MKQLLDLAYKEFRLSPDSLHGVSHWESVEVMGMYLAQFTGADEAVVRYFAYIHDSQRLSEHEDPLHGVRASEFAQNIFDKGALDLTKSQLLLLKKACEVHNTSPTNPLDPTIATCLDADRLDLRRLGIQPSETLLFTVVGKKIGKDKILCDQITHHTLFSRPIITKDDVV